MGLKLPIKDLPSAGVGGINLTSGAMLLPASILFGWLWQTFNPQTASAAACALLAALLLKFKIAAPANIEKSKM